MERIMTLLREKNNHLEKFYWVNEQELINFGVGNFETIERFYEARDQILNTIRNLDVFIEEAHDRAVGQVTAELRSELRAILEGKDQLVKSILAQDLQILSYIEREKSNIIRELKANSQVKKAVGAYANSERLKHLDQD